MFSSLLTYREVTARIGAEACGLVLDAADFHGVAIIRALGRMGAPVYALGEAGSLGFYSRYVRESWSCRTPHDPDILMPALLDIGKKLQTRGQKVVLFPTGDKQVRFLCQNQGVLSQYFVTHFPTLEVFEQCGDKLAQCRAAAQHDVPAPRTYFSEEIDRLLEDVAAGKLQFPIIFKARKELPWQLRKIFRIIVIKDREHLFETVKRATAENVSFLIQEIIPGGDDTLYTLGSCMTKAGELTTVFTGRKLRQRPPRFGECRVGESVPVEAIVRDGEKLLRALKFFGISQVEFKFDARDGKYKLIEVNPRAWSWIGLPVAMGINIPYAFFCDALGVPVAATRMGTEHALWISLYHDLYWSLREHDGRPWAHLFKDYDRKVESYFSTNDLKPSLIHLQRATVKFAGVLWQRLLKKLGRKSGPED